MSLFLYLCRIWLPKLSIVRYFFHISFNGNKYHGWQRQRDAISVREVFETNLLKVMKQYVECIGCGRTDSQVHASQFFFHADIEKEWDFDLQFRLNKSLPNDISVFHIIPVEDFRHARYDAISRTYDYFIHTFKDPFLIERSSFYDVQKLDIEKMKQAVKLISGYTDFHSFCLSPAKQPSTICRIMSARLFTDSTESRLRFQITANRFLRGMVRTISGKLIDVGTGKMSLQEFEHLLVDKPTLFNIRPAFPEGLYLTKVTYPYLDILPHNDLTAGMRTEWIEVS